MFRSLVAPMQSRLSLRAPGEDNTLIKPLMVAVALGCIAAPAVAQKPAPTKLETSGALFGVRETVEYMDISPDGSRVVYVTPGPGRTSAAYVAELGTGAEQLVVSSDGSPQRLSWCRFASNRRLICRISGQVDDAGLLVPFTRMFAVGIDGKNLKPLGQRSTHHDERRRQFDADILDWLPDEGGAVLVARDYIPEAGKMNTKLVRKQDGLGIDRIDVETMAATPVEAPVKDADFFISDGRGKVRIKGHRPSRGGTGQLASRVNYAYRLSGSMKWAPFSSWDDDEGMAPIAVEAETDSAYVLKKLDGRLALYRVKLDGSMAAELVYKNDKVDVDGVVRIGNGARVIGVTFAEEIREVIYFDPEYKRLAASLGQALPNQPMVDYLGSSADNSKLLIRAGGDSDPGRYYVFDKSSRALNEIMLARPALEHVKLASVKPITYPAADGTAIPAYLTLPPGAADARGLPAVVLPHGGPSARDEWGFDWLAQFLAHEGYAVLQPNYRGSAGYGDAWYQENGFKSWETSIGDVTSAGRWLVDEGIADPAKLAVVGWSYGGYAALQSGVTKPELFKAIVAIAPVTDLDLVKQEARHYTNARNIAEQIGSGPHVVQGSPLQNVQRIDAPVLMFHGSMDLNVGVDQSRSMDAKLRAAGKSSELVVYEGLAHGLADSNARALMLDRIAGFLGEHLTN
jgi:acetyl esterase/lipase